MTGRPRSQREWEPASFRNRAARSEEHTSELQSQSNLVCRLLLEKKKNRACRRRHQSDVCAVDLLDYPDAVAVSAERGAEEPACRAHVPTSVRVLDAEDRARLSRL